MCDNIHRPPLSGNVAIRHRLSKESAEPEWYWKLSPILPQLWIRNSSKLTAETVRELEQAWLRYQILNIPGKGDGANWSGRTKRGRRKLEDAYERLDDDVRRAKEVALARYPNFVIDGVDGSLDYNTNAPKQHEGLFGGLLRRFRRKLRGSVRELL